MPSYNNIRARGIDVPSILLIALATTAAASGATFTVTKTTDTADGSCSIVDCSLREAILAANASPSPDTVVIPAGVYA